MSDHFGYAGKILRVDLSSEIISELATAEYTEKFLGGRGIATKIYWDEVLPEVNVFDPENRLIFITGPLAGVPGLAGSRWMVCGKSPTTKPELFSYCNLGGSWGAQLKFAGYDGIIIQGKSEKPVYLLVEEGKAELCDGSYIWGKGAVETRESLKQNLGSSIRVVAIGQAGENMVVLANLLADDDASGSSGFGAVMGSKKLKAIAVRGKRKVEVAEADKLQELRKYIRKLMGKPLGPLVNSPRIKPFACYGCVSGCIRSIYEGQDGKKGKIMCQSGLFYQSRAIQDYAVPRGRLINVGEFDEVAFNANRLCDEYGIDTNAFEAMINWLAKCNQLGLLTEESTGIPFSKIGSLEFIETLIKKISFREGFGDILANGSIRTGDVLGDSVKEIISEHISRAGQDLAYDPREYITTGLFYAMEPRQSIQQIHEISSLILSWMMWAYMPEIAHASSDVVRSIAKKFWGSELAADFSTYEGKALAAKKIQDREYAIECLILCNFLWPKLFVEESEDHVGDPAVESKVLSMVTGKDVDEQGLYEIGSRIFNLQRAILLREGHRGRIDDTLPEVCYSKPLDAFWFNPACILPGKDGEVMPKMGSVIDKAKFESMKDEYYALRGWDVATGLPPKSILEKLGISDVSRDLVARNLIV